MVTRHRLCRTLSPMLLVAAAGCKPDLEGRPSQIDSPQVVAIRSTPAEALAGDGVKYDLLLVQPLNDTSTPTYDWALCLAREPLASPGPVAESCLVPSGSDLQDLGGTLTAAATIPANDCQLFGPITPTPKTGEPALRPADPDTTGGYYQPVRLLTVYGQNNSQYAVGVTRLNCGMAGGATLEQTVQYNKSYRANQNPNIQSIAFARSNGDVITIDPTTAPATVAKGEALSFTVSWPICPATASCGDGVCSAGEDSTDCPDDCENPQGCAGSEYYLSYDPSSQALQNRRESIRVAWYATDGTFEHDSTGRAESEADTNNTSNVWTAPSNATTVRVWLVIRDDRRGVNWTQFDVQVAQ